MRPRGHYRPAADDPDDLVSTFLGMGSIGVLSADPEASRDVRRAPLGFRRPEAAPQPVEGPLALLTARQRLVLELRIRGRGRRQIAEELGLSARTVREEFDRARAATGTSDEFELLLVVDRQLREPA